MNTPDYWIEWVEPLGDGAEPMYMRAKASDIAAVRRRHEPRYESDEAAIDDFIVIHWAQRVPKDPMSRVEELRQGLFEARDAMRVMAEWSRKVDPAGYGWAGRMVDRANAVLSHDPDACKQIVTSN